MPHDSAAFLEKQAPPSLRPPKILGFCTHIKEAHMPATSPLAGGSTMAFVNVKELDRARAFYEGILGLHIVSADDFALVAELGGVRLRIAQVPEPKLIPYTVAGFEVPDAQAAHEKLAAAGITFELYPFLGPAQSPNGIWHAPGGTRIAWFKDPDGNLLSISDAP
jgi:catechol 2,3-dioxygenase-like lactoylglutathione lyase family enzyme